MTKDIKYIVVPDVHGRDFWIEPCQHIEEFDKVIFLGDYHDPYTFQVSEDTSRHRFRDILLPFVLEHKDKVICCPEQIAYYKSWISKEKLQERADLLKKNTYGEYLQKVIDETK